MIKEKVVIKGKFPKEIDGHVFHPDTLVAHLGFAPAWSDYSANVPIFPTSTYVLPSAEEGECAFDPDIAPENKPNFYTRFNGPNTEIAEERLAALESAGASALFGSGMAAIGALCEVFLESGDIIVHSEPLYGNTDRLFKQKLCRRGIHSCGFSSEEELKEILHTGSSVKMVFVETPANPTMKLYDISAIAEHTRSFLRHDVLVVVDNTFLGPIGQRPLKHGADMVVHSATKSLGGHGDLTGGVVMGSREHIHTLKSERGTLGSIMQPFDAWLLTTHLQTLSLRVNKQAENAGKIAHHLTKKREIERVHYPGLVKGMTSDSPHLLVFMKQCSNAGHMISFDLAGGKKAAFSFLNNLDVFEHAVSLGGVRSLACHPASTTHRCVSEDDRKKFSITDGLVRLSIGTEHVDDLIWDIDQALAKAHG